MSLYTRCSASYLPGSSPLISSYSDAAPALFPKRSRPYCTHHLFPHTSPVSLLSLLSSPESFASQFITQLYSASLAHTLPSLRIPLPESPSTEGCSTISRQIAAVDASPWSVARPCVGTPPRDRLMRGFITHVSAPIIRTSCTTALRIIPGNLGLPPYLTRILDRQSHIFWGFCRFSTTSGQLSYESINICPKYLKDITVTSGLS